MLYPGVTWCNELHDDRNNDMIVTSTQCWPARLCYYWRQPTSILLYQQGEHCTGESQMTDAIP